MYRAIYFFSVITLFLAGCLKSDNRSDFYLKRVSFPEGTTIEEKVKMAAHVVPTDMQLEWQTLEMTAFVHFTINTYTDLEWGHGDESPEIFNPVEFNALQWAETVREAGLKMIIVTCKHHDGFCLWPTKTTTHSVAASPWREGNGDIVKEVKEACEKTGLKFGVYLSPWDRNAECYGDSPAYNKFFMEQLTELLTWYGKVDEVWFDGANGEGPNGKRQIYDWEAYYSVIEKLQPEALVAIVGEDIRWVGTESGYGRETEWSVTPLAPGGRSSSREINESLNINAMNSDLGSRELIDKASELFWYPSEVDVSIRPGWFYHASQDIKVKSLAKLVDIYFSSVGRNSVLLLNIPPDKRGLFHENDVARLREFGQYIDKVFEKNMAFGASTPVKRGERLVDNDRSTRTILDDSKILEFELLEKSRFNVVLLQEYIENGQRVESFFVDAFLENEWTRLCESTTIGYKKLLRVPETETNRIRLTITGSRETPEISEFGLFYAPGILTDPSIIRDRSGLVSITTESEGPVIKYTTDGSEPDKSSAVYNEPFYLKTGGIIKARSYINNYQKSGNTIVEDFDICKEDWKVTGLSDQVVGYPGPNAIDGNPNTMWHTHWTGEVKPHPHYLDVDMGKEQILKGFTYYPRTDENKSGTVVSFSFYISQNGKSWTKVISNGEFSNIKHNPVKQYIRFGSAVEARFFRFESVSGAFDEPWLSVGELGIITR